MEGGAFIIGGYGVEGHHRRRKAGSSVLPQHPSIMGGTPMPRDTGVPPVK
jgi:hypothetical protein